MIAYHIRYVLFLCIVLLCVLPAVVSDEKFGIDNLDFQLGQHEGISLTSTITHENMQKILAGVENGNRDNIYFYGLLKLYGISLSKDLALAAQNFNRASSLGHKEATTAYGVMLMSGHGVRKDLAGAMKYFRKGVELGDMNAHWLLGKMLLDGRGLPAPAYAEAAALFRVAAEENIPQALHSLAIMHEYGTGVEQNFDAAIKLYRRASELHYTESIYNLAMMYAFARGCERDFERARSLLETAAQTNHAPSIYYIGVFKTYGYGCEINYNQAINWFERAAGLDDFRVSNKAAKAAEELRTKVDAAHIQNERLMDELQRKGEGLRS